MNRSPNYLFAVCHPWACLLFLLPLLIAYEGGVFFLGGAESDALRNGADNWLRWIMQVCGLQALYWPPIMIVIIFFVWNLLRRSDRPEDLVGVWTGMAVESIVFALTLWGLARSEVVILPRHSSGSLWLAIQTDPKVALMISFVGAGIYEELLFRLMLYPALRGLFTLVGFFRVIAIVLGMAISSLLFAAAHHIGPYGEPLQLNVFLFRTLAGLYFALLFQLRGFGIAVGAHACYDVLVGFSIASME